MTATPQSSTPKYCSNSNADAEWLAFPDFWLKELQLKLKLRARMGNISFVFMINGFGFITMISTHPYTKMIPMPCGYMPVMKPAFSWIIILMYNKLSGQQMRAKTGNRDNGAGKNYNTLSMKFNRKKRRINKKDILASILWGKIYKCYLV